MKRGFTLIEVNLAMLIMAGGILSIVGLYAFGFRENRQGREDVATAAMADAVMSPLTMAISSTNVTWQSFSGGFVSPPNGWGDYVDDNGVVKSANEVMRLAKQAYDEVKGKLGVSSDNWRDFPEALFNEANLVCGLVVRHPENSATVSIAFHAVNEDKPGTLLASPLYYTEVRFQGEKGNQ